MTSARASRLASRALVLLVLSTALTLAALAQGIGTIRGIVVDVNGKPVKGATVKAGSGGGPVATDAGGLFQLKVKPGTHEVTATMKGYAPDTARGVEVKAGATKDISLVLVPG